MFQEERRVSHDSSSTSSEEVQSKSDSNLTTLSLQQESVVEQAQDVVETVELVGTSEDSEQLSLQGRSC